MSIRTARCRAGSRCHVRHALARGVIMRRRWLALMASGLAVTVLPTPSLSQAFDQTIDGTSETVSTGSGATLPAPWFVAGVLRVGRNLTDSRLSIMDHGEVRTDGGWIGDGATGNGTVVLRGDGSSWLNAGSLTVGHAGQGSLEVLEASGMRSADGRIGVQATGGGRVTVSGAGSRWMIADTLEVGGAGRATVSVTGSGTLSSAAAVIGRAATGRGEASIAGGDSLWRVTDGLTIGGEGKGTLQVSAAGRLESRSGKLGDLAGGRGDARVDGDGSWWVIADRLDIGNAGTGDLAITAAGQASSRAASLGVESGGGGAVLVSGSGSWLGVERTLTIGERGSGVLTVAADGTVDSGTGSIGTTDTGAGAVLVDGSGSQWRNRQGLAIGEDGDGRLRLTAGGRVSSDTATLGVFAGGTGHVTLDGTGSDLAVRSHLRVGEEGAGHLEIGTGATARAGSLTLGGSADGSGALRIDGNGSTLHVDGPVDVGTNGTGSLTVSGGGRMTVNDGAGTIRLATEAGSSGRLTIGGAAGDTARGAGTVDANRIEFGAGDGAVIFNHGDQGYVFTPSIRGHGAVEVHGGHTILVGDTQHTGGTRVFGGTLSVNGSIAGPVTVTGGRLGGSGYSASLSIGSGATLAPGNSIGVTRAGSATFATGSVYAVEVNSGGASDRLSAAGGVTVEPGAVVAVTPENGTDTGAGYALLSRYRIVEAAGGLSGRFSGVTDSFALLDATLSYTADSAVLSLRRNDAGFSNFAVSPNGLAVARVLDRRGAGDALHDAAAQTGLSQLGPALDVLSGAIHASLPALIMEAGYDLGTAIARATEDPDGAGLWMQSHGALARRDAAAHVAIDSHSGGVLAGIDVARGPRWRAGLIGGYETSRHASPATAAEVRAESHSLGAYGTAAFSGMRLQLGADYSWHRYATGRHIALPGLTETLVARYGASTARLQARMGRQFALGDLTFEPFLGLAFLHHRAEAYSESGGVFALSGDAMSATSVISTLGTRVDARLTDALTLFGAFAWTRVAGDLQVHRDQAFNGSERFSTIGAPIARHSAEIELGASLALASGLDLALNYRGVLSNLSTRHGGQARLSKPF